MNGPCVVSIHRVCHRVKYSSNYRPYCHFEISPHVPCLMSPNDDEWRVGIFSNSSPVPVPNLSTEHSQVDRWLSEFWFKRSTTKINSFFISPSEGKQPEAEDENIIFLKYLSNLQRIVIFMSLYVPNSHFNVSQSTKVKETSKSLRLQTLWWAPLQTYFLQKFSCNSYIILQQTNKTFTAFANYFSKPDIFTDWSSTSLKSVMFACSK